jgi:hypothetical protein
MKPFGFHKIMEAFFSNVALLLIVSFIVAACSEVEPESVTRNIRVIAQAEVDGNIVEGSAVMGLRWEPCCNGGMQPKHNTEAVILELDEKKTVYILDATIWPDGETDGAYWSTYVASALGLNLTVELSDFQIIRNATGRYPVLESISKTKTLPVMVSFENETKRETMFHVTPSNFSEKIGSNIKFVGLWFEFTEASPTVTIQRRLPLMFQRKVNESYREKYPSKDAAGKLIPIEKHQFSRHFGKRAFKKEDF